ncbi:Uncharacterized protein APZ42_015006 [Daphnia magna]|uniref:Uncharacterized protein n=1 Tax=Daphnia magna TaxID=35525 RepID=A0A162P3R3_9CRUS|nr:Uncharacterized protein APZ42_015006 [Daphnia magna]
MCGKKKWDGVGKDCTIEDWTHENRKLFFKKKEKKRRNMASIL